MQFVRVSWKILVGLKDLLVLLFLLLFFAAIFALLNASPNPAMVRDGALLLKLQVAMAGLVDGNRFGATVPVQVPADQNHGCWWPGIQRKP